MHSILCFFIISETPFSLFISNSYSIAFFLAILSTLTTDSLDELLKLSIIRTLCPLFNKHKAVCEPIYPAPPVTNIFIITSKYNISAYAYPFYTHQYRSEHPHKNQPHYRL